jgi:hypothetical protein
MRSRGDGGGALATVAVLRVVAAAVTLAAVVWDAE